MIVGIVLGLAAAFCQSLSYLFSRVFVGKFHRSTVTLLTLSHIVMGVLSLILLPFVWPAMMPRFGEYAFPLIACTVFYLLGQVSLFLALKRSDASRVSPLLGLKIIMLATISITFLGQRYSLPQWSAVVLSVCAAGLLNWTGGTMLWQSIVWTLIACFGYCLSDLYIWETVRHFLYLGLAQSSVLSACLCYILCGGIGLVTLVFLPRSSATMWIQAVPFAVTWFVAMLFLYACFMSIGVVFGNIVQASRGVISIVLGSLVATMGFVQLEGRVTPSVLLRRIGAAVLMMAAIALFYLGG